MRRQNHRYRFGVIFIVALLASTAAGAQESRWKELDAQIDQLQKQGKNNQALPVAEEAPALLGKMYDVLLWQQGLVTTSVAGPRAQVAAVVLQETAKGPLQAGGQDPGELVRQAVAVFRADDCPSAIRLFRQVTEANPADIVAYNMSGNCSLKLKDYPAAIDAFKHALQIRPDEWHNISGLIHAYSLAGMTQERDELQKHIGELEHDGKLPDTFSYIFETFQVANQQVEVSKYPKITGFYGERYRFNVYNKDGMLVFRVALESAELEQPQWAKEHKELAAAGGRKFSLDGYSSEGHYTYGFYDGEPEYLKLREEVEEVLAGKKPAITHSTSDKLR